MDKVTPVLFYNASDIMEMLDVGQTTAYKIINNLRKELVSKGYAEYPAGKIPKKYFHERYYGSDPADQITDIDKWRCK
jgi:predicted transcriptional regulator